MILLVHILFGAAIGSVVKSIPIAIILAFLSHYFLDSLPHIEYPIENIEKKQWRKAIPDVLRVVLDFCLGALLILLFSSNKPVIYACSLAAILPDGFMGLNNLLPNKLSNSNGGIHQKTHFLIDKKIPIFWRIFIQVAIIAVSIAILKF